MPTPFYHLSVAQDLLEHPALPSHLRRFLNQHRSAFLLGNTAPDVQVVSGQPREATHFYTIPMRAGAPPAEERMLSLYPNLVDVRGLDSDRAAFLAGYLCHLQADEQWVREIFDPGFGLNQGWGTFPQRLYIHNVLRAYLDQQVLPSLPGDTGAQLARSPVSAWLPFVKELDLKRWRSFLCEQLQPGGGVRTVEVFARRQGLNASDFHELLDSTERMEREVFTHMPYRQLEKYRQDLYSKNTLLIIDYLADISLKS